jgi:hypothetical protein
MALVQTADANVRGARRDYGWTHGLHWIDVGENPPITDGVELTNSSLEKALKSKTTFNADESKWRGMEIMGNDFIKSGEKYFQPATSRCLRVVKRNLSLYVITARGL